MSPEIYIGGFLVADVPDVTGHHRTIMGRPLAIVFDPENPERIVVQAPELAGKPERKTQHGRREFELNRLGIGSQKLPKGVAVVRLREPIFVSKKDINGSQIDRVSSPVWQRSRGRR